jgi:monoamine oxidase
MTTVVRAVLSVEPSECSLLYFFHYFLGARRLGEKPKPSLLFEGGEGEGAQSVRILGGSYNVSRTLASKLGEDIVLYNHPVHRIEQNEESVRITTESGQIFRAKYAVCAFSPALVPQIQFEPLLPAPRDDLNMRFPMGKVIKCLAFYSENFWRKKNLSGEIVTQNGEITMGFDATLKDDSSPALVAFIMAESARYWSQQPQEKRKEMVLSNLAKFFGDEALHPIHYMDRDWSQERWSRGGYTGVALPGTLSSCGWTLRTPFKRVHWAGTETARVWTGYMEGALESSERVSEELIQRLEGKEWTPVEPRKHSF